MIVNTFATSDWLCEPPFMCHQYKIGDFFFLLVRTLNSSARFNVNLLCVLLVQH